MIRHRVAEGADEEAGVSAIDLSSEKLDDSATVMDVDDARTPTPIGDRYNRDTATARRQEKRQQRAERRERVKILRQQFGIPSRKALKPVHTHPLRYCACVVLHMCLSTIFCLATFEIGVLASMARSHYTL